MFKVLKPFKTVNRRFSVGDTVRHDDCYDTAQFEALSAHGFIGPFEPDPRPADAEPQAPDPQAA